MKVAVIYNRESQSVINTFGKQNREKYGKTSIKRITDSLKAGGHQVKAFEGDKDLVKKLEEFMPRTTKGELPGMAFNLSYGIQGNARYTHVPGILEMVGIPYVGSGPLAHSLALDKVVAKMIFLQNGLPTPKFAVLESLDFPEPDIPYPLIVKPRDEAVSFGLKIVNTQEELRAAAKVIFDEFDGTVLVEQFIDGRELNVGVLGNDNPMAFEPVELIFGEGAPNIYTEDDKKGRSGREVVPKCPAEVTPEVASEAKRVAIRAFNALGCSDCCRVDLRMDHDGNLYLLEINSLPSLGERGSYVVGADHAGYNFARLVNKLVNVASDRYFGENGAEVPELHTTKSKDPLFKFITQRRDKIEKSLHEWVQVSSRTSDAVGLRLAAQQLDKQMREIGLRSLRGFSDERTTVAWETEAGFDGGTLIVGHLDVPLSEHAAVQKFQREPERLLGEGIGSSRAPLAMALNAFRALKNNRTLQQRRIGALFYMDEGLDCRYSRETIARAASHAKQVLVLRPGNTGDMFITQRRGQRRYRLIVEGKSARLGQVVKGADPLLWLAPRLQEMSALTSKKDRIAIAVVDMRTEHYPMLMPHRVRANILVSYPATGVASEIEAKIREILGKSSVKWSMEEVSDRPPMPQSRANTKLAKAFTEAAGHYEIPMNPESSVWPSVAGLAPSSVPVICGLGPVSQDLYTPSESINRLSLIQRTLALAEFLANAEG